MRADVVIVGGGIVGSSIAYHLARTGRAGDVVVIERDPTYEHAATPRSNGGIRRLFSLPENIEMASHGLAFYRDFADEMAVDGERAEIGFRRQGYLFVSDGGGAAQMEENFALQERMGVEVELLSPPVRSQTRFPSVSPRGVDRCGALRARRLDRPPCRAHGVPAQGPLARSPVRHRGGDRARRGFRRGAGGPAPRRHHVDSAEVFVNACGAWCAALGAMVGLDLPVEPMSRENCYFTCADPIEPLPLIKTETDLAFRPEGAGYTGGVPDWSEPAGWNFDISPTWFEEVVWPALARRIPAMERVRLERSWRGHYARSALDYSPILGRWEGGLENLVLANGFSGHGIMHAPATGRGIAELIVDGDWQTIDLSCFSYRRIPEGRPYREKGIV